MDLVLSDANIEAHALAYRLAGLLTIMTFEQFLMARMACKRRSAVRLDRVGPNDYSTTVISPL